MSNIDNLNQSLQSEEESTTPLFEFISNETSSDIAETLNLRWKEKYSQARFLARSWNYAEAIMFYMAYLDSTDKISDIEYSNIWFAFYKLKEYKKAVQYYKRSYEKNPENFINIQWLAHSAKLAWDYDTARKFYEILIDSGEEKRKQWERYNIPSSIDYANYAGILKRQWKTEKNPIFQTMKYETACMYYERSLEKNPNNLITMQDFAYTLKQLWKFEESQKMYELLIEKSQEFHHTKLPTAIDYSNYWWVLKELWKFEQAKNAYIKSLEKDPRNNTTIKAFQNLMISQFG